MEQELIDKIANSGIKKSKIEDDLKIPKNSLAGMISGSRATPKKWAVKIAEYLDENKKEFGFMKPDGTSGILTETPEWAKVVDVELDATERNNLRLIHQYCEENGLTVAKLIWEHSQLKKEPKPSQLPPQKEVIVTDLNKQAEPKGSPYDPEKNWRFKAKNNLK